MVPDAVIVTPFKDDFVSISIRFNDVRYYFVTELQDVSDNWVSIDYDPIRLESRAIITIGSFVVGTNVMPLATERVVTIQARDVRLWLAADKSWLTAESECRHGAISDHLEV